MKSEAQKRLEQKILSAKLFEIHDKILNDEVQKEIDIFKQYYTFEDYKTNQN